VGAAASVAPWADPIKFFTADSPLGKTAADIRKKMFDAFRAKGKRVLVSAFGAFDFPTHRDPTKVCTDLANFTKDNGFDGVDLDYEDNEAMEAGTGEAWVITCTKVIR